MDPVSFNTTILIPGLVSFQKLVPAIPVTRNVRVLMLAIAGQESNWSARVQGGNGPGHGFFQFERMGGVNGVLKHPLTADPAIVLCKVAGVQPTPDAVWAKLATIAGDPLAVGFARLLLWTDPRPIPSPDKGAVAWGYYVRNWRPGSPGPDRWPTNLDAANAAVAQ